EVGVGTFDHTIQMQSKGQPVVAVTQYGHYPGFVLATIASKSIAYRGPQSLKGLTIGVTSPGSSTHFMAAYMLVRSGLKADDAPGGVVYTTADFIAKKPRTVQAIVTAFVRALKWMSAHPAEDIATAVPQEYALGNREVYVRALAASEAMYSPNG